MANPRITRAVLRIHHYHCQYCGGAAEVVDHIIPRALGGSDSPNNLIAACQSCNASKSSKRLHPELEKTIRMSAFIHAEEVQISARSELLAAQHAKELRTFRPNTLRFAS